MESLKTDTSGQASHLCATCLLTVSRMVIGIHYILTTSDCSSFPPGPVQLIPKIVWETCMQSFGMNTREKNFIGDMDCPALRTTQGKESLHAGGPFTSCAGFRNGYPTLQVMLWLDSQLSFCISWREKRRWKHGLVQIPFKFWLNITDLLNTCTTATFHCQYIVRVKVLVELEQKYEVTNSAW